MKKALALFVVLLSIFSLSATGTKENAESKEKLQQIYDEIDKMERSKIEVSEYKRLHEEFHPFVIWGLIMLGLSFLLKNSSRNKG